MEPRAEGATIVVVAGGDPVPRGASLVLPAGVEVIAADAGVDEALRLGWPVALAVGDFDSVSPAGLARVRAEGAEVRRHPAAKDATDLELALDEAVRRGATRVVVVGGNGGRLDHLVANVALLGAPRFAVVELDAYLAPATVTVVRAGAGRARSLRGAMGDLVSLLPLGGPALGVTTSGLRYALNGEDLDPGGTRGVSNEMLGTLASVSLGAGVVLAVQPEGPPPELLGAAAARPAPDGPAAPGPDER